MIKLALTDLDDTLIPYGAPSASDRAIAAIGSLLDRGIHFGPVSGRVPDAMGWMFADEGRCFATGAFANGQVVRIDGEIVHEESLESALLQEVADLLDGRGAPALLATYDVYGNSAPVFVTRRRGALVDELMDGAGMETTVVSAVGGTSWLKSNIHCACDRDEMAQIRDLLRQELPELGFVFPSLVAPFIDISPAGWDKGAAVRWMAAELGIDLDEVATFGDSENDLSMIEAVPNSVAVANAADVVAQAARWHIGPSEEDAVAAALEDIAQAAETDGLPAFMGGGVA
ncbi:HAD hydrolase family protein [Olsenella sp. HMSC062G07]|uniref:HAD hydrolase family protein n=1 Tax=Olsenella sp. HMSC062G07 TaxID=1739330 RepID=UPI0008A26048|nr:HAD family hydrolase [Olsenella sp. HMSC062G07]OFK23425.1 hypothetical protein HMPREF2826_04910 [Olsenella sp. HMSC062G07]